MHTITLTPDEIDDLLYFTRVNETRELEQTILELSKRYSCEPKDVIQECIDPQTGNTMLHYCSANGLAELLPVLLEQLHSISISTGPNLNTSFGAFLNHVNEQGNTALHWAAYNGHLPCVKSLITAGADMWIKNAAGHLAMFEAERAEKSDVVQYLLEIGGTSVEKVGVEKPASEEDIAGTASEETRTAAEASGGNDIDMEEPKPHG